MDPNHWLANLINFNNLYSLTKIFLAYEVPHHIAVLFIIWSDIGNVIFWYNVLSVNYIIFKYSNVMQYSTRYRNIARFFGWKPHKLQAGKPSFEDAVGLFYDNSWSAQCFIKSFFGFGICHCIGCHNVPFAWICRVTKKYTIISAFKWSIYWF